MLVLGWGKKALAPQHLEPGAPLGNWAEGYLYHYSKGGSVCGDKEPWGSLEMAAERGSLWLLKSRLPSLVPARSSKASSSPFLGQWLWGERGTPGKREGREGRDGPRVASWSSGRSFWVEGPSRVASASSDKL